ncbi:MAG TPA: ABC transporter permease [Bryobacteraceae bacterium]|nr:ABC transporter permease [Bryobacteraceae bacterium]
MSYLLEAKYECLKLLRTPGRLGPLVLFPLVFYGFFGLGTKQGTGQVQMSTYLLGTYGVFGVMGAALMGIGAGVAVERGLGWMQVKRASPMPSGADLLAKVLASTLLGLTIVSLLLAIGFVWGGVRLDIADTAALVATLVAGTVPFCALGLAIGYFASAQSVHAVVNLFYLPMAFCSGLWVPISMLPEFLRDIAPALPAYHLAQTALLILRQPAAGSIGGHVAALAAFTVVFLGLAWLGHSLDESRS